MKANILISLIAAILIFFSSPDNIRAASLLLTIPDGNPGQQIIASVGFEAIQDMVSFHLVLDFTQGNILSTEITKFIRNTDFYPQLSIGGQAINFEKEVSTGKLAFIGLSPICQSSSFKIGEIPFQIAASAQSQDQHVISLRGQIYSTSGAVSELTPVSKTFSVRQIIDTDKDGMDDAWEQQYFGNLSQNGTGDFDKDGISNLQEYLNGTDPTKPPDKGDINGDGVIGLYDVVLALQVSAGMTPQNVYMKADTNADGTIGIDDAIYALQFFAGMRQ